MRSILFPKRSSVANGWVPGMPLLIACLWLGGISLAAAQQSVFPSPEAAAAALVEALGANDDGRVLDLFGHEYREFLIGTDKAASREDRRRLHEAAQTLLELETREDDSVVLLFGEDAWPFAIPLVRAEEGWRFDTAAGIEEFNNRRIGRNELNAIEVARAYLEAQREYASLDRDGDEVMEYAQKLLSTEGKRDGLYWPVKPGSAEEPSPFGPLVAEAGRYVEGAAPGDPYLGYRFRILTRQGDQVPGGHHEYVINGNMIAGFALVAFPADYGYSGVMTFVVNQSGKVYQKDLGEDTLAIAGTMRKYNPGPGWTEVVD